MNGQVDIRTLSPQEQVRSLAKGGPTDAARGSNNAELASTSCLIRFIRHVYYIRVIQEGLHGQTFHGYPEAEKSEPILEFAWQQGKLPHCPSGETYRLKETMGQCDNTVSMINSRLMEFLLWARPEYRFYNVSQNGIRHPVAEAHENAGPLVWHGNISLQAAVNCRFDHLDPNNPQEPAIIRGSNEPTLLKVAITDSSQRMVPGALWVKPGPKILSDYAHVKHSSDQIYTLVAAVSQGGRGTLPDMRLLNPSKDRFPTDDFYYNPAPGVTCVLLYAKFNRVDLGPRGLLMQMLHPSVPRAMPDASGLSMSGAPGLAMPGTSGLSINAGPQDMPYPPETYYDSLCAHFQMPVPRALVCRSPRPFEGERPAKRVKTGRQVAKRNVRAMMSPSPLPQPSFNPKRGLKSNKNTRRR